MCSMAYMQNEFGYLDQSRVWVLVLMGLQYPGLGAVVKAVSNLITNMDTVPGILPSTPAAPPDRNSTTADILGSCTCADDYLVLRRCQHSTTTSSLPGPEDRHMPCNPTFYHSRVDKTSWGSKCMHERAQPTTSDGPAADRAVSSYLQIWFCR